jgi:hypothetical protein
MAKLHGIVIADPAKSNLRFNKIENDHYDISRKLPGKPLGRYISEQDRLNNFERLMPSPRLVDTVKERTIPMNSTLNKDMIDLWRERRVNLRAEVEQPQLEAEKKVSGATVDAHNLTVTETHGINFGNHYNPAGNYPTPKFKQDVRINMKHVHPVGARLSNAKLYAEQSHYLYKNEYGSFRKYYYEENPWKSSQTGRVHLFDRKFTRIFS